jgi:hypothetical protein
MTAKKQEASASDTAILFGGGKLFDIGGWFEKWQTD